jgi:hypothetical protein
VSDKNYPCYPSLTEEGKKEAQIIVDKFKEKLSDVAKKTIGEFYCDVATYIETDSWTNFRNEIMDGYRDYDNRKIQGEYDFKEIRQAIYKKHKKEIIDDLNSDLVEENKKLKEQIERMNNNR